MSIREATTDDLFDLVSLTKKFWKEGNYTSMRFDPDYVADNYRKLLNHETGVIFVSENDFEIQGMLAAIAMHQAFSNDLAAYEMAWYVDKEARGSTVAFRLVQAYENWAKEKGCSFINMSRIDSVSEDKVPKMYGKLGLKIKEYTYIKEI